MSFFAGVFVILSLGKISSGAAGISLTYALGFTESILWLIRLSVIPSLSHLILFVPGTDCAL